MNKFRTHYFLFLYFYLFSIVNLTFESDLLLSFGFHFNLKLNTANASETHPTDESQKKVHDIQEFYKIHVEDPYCVGDKEDPFEVGPRMPDGPMTGQCLDVEKNRALIVLNGELTTPSSQIEIANVRHGRKWWRAQFNSGNEQFPTIDKVYYLLVELPRSIPWIMDGHVELRFTFKNDTELKLQSQVTTVQDWDEVGDFIFSQNAYGVNGVPFSPIAGTKKEFGVIGNLVSTYDRAIDEIVYSHAKVNQIELKLTNQQKIDLFLNAIKRSANTLQYKAMYHTLFFNCVVNTMNLIDDTIPRPPGVPDFITEYSRWTGGAFFNNPWIGIVPHVNDLFFGPSVQALKERNLIQNWAPTLNEEYRGGDVAWDKLKRHANSERHPAHPKR